MLPSSTQESFHVQHEQLLWEAEQARLLKLARTSREPKTLKKQLGESLVRLANRLLTEPEFAEA